MGHILNSFRQASREQNISLCMEQSIVQYNKARRKIREHSMKAPGIGKIFMEKVGLEEGG